MVAIFEGQAKSDVSVYIFSFLSDVSRRKPRYDWGSQCANGDDRERSEAVRAGQSDSSVGKAMS